MTNSERRNALNKARAQALRHATWAEEYFATPADRDYAAQLMERHQGMAKMWAAVAEAYKDGDPAHDAADNTSASHFAPPGHTETR